MLMSALLPTLLCLLVQDHGIEASPFDGLRWNEGQPEALIEDVWYQPVAIDGIAVEEILATCNRRWPGKMEKRFAEDLVEALSLMEWEGDLRVDLDLTRLSDGKSIRLEAVEMTKDRRNALRDSQRNAAATPRNLPSTISVDQAESEIELFLSALRDQFAYVSLRDVDLDAELDQIREGLAEPVSVSELAASLHRVLMKCGDGHAGVSSPIPSGERSDRYLPFLLIETASGVVALKPDRKGLFEPDRPVVVEIDGRPLVEWMASVEPQIAAGSPQLIRRRALGALREIDVARRALGEETGGPVQITFANRKGKKKKTREIELSSRRPTFGEWPRSESRILPSDIGYVRIARMDDDVDSLHEAMDELVDTKGLVVDVRGNGGGSRDLLLALAGYLIGPDEPAVVGNVASYRLSPSFRDSHLEARFMYRADWNGWNDRQRAAIDALAPKFRSEWTPPEEHSEWHYLVMDRTGDDSEYFYDLPVVVLSDSGCFSATDIFLGALELLPRVTLIGTASSGGSARTQSFALPATGIEVRCASMASFRPDGRLYDGRGIEVDEEVLPAPEDFLIGGGDTQLDAAIKHLTRQRR